MSLFDADVYASHEVWRQRLASSPVRVQWDPERDTALEPLPWRSLQVGLGRAVVPAYVDEWVVGLEDVTAQVRQLRELPPSERSDLPVERPYPLPPQIAAVIGATAVS